MYVCVGQWWVEREKWRGRNAKDIRGEGMREKERRKRGKERAGEKGRRGKEKEE